jgi:hypothetical protein
MQARYYDPVIGRFYSNDPVGFKNVHNFNRYTYANNNPYKYTDPTGMTSKPTQKTKEELERKREIQTANNNRQVPIKSESGLGANKMLTVSKTHDGINSKTTKSVTDDELKVAQAFCQCESVEQTVQTFDADSAAQFNDSASLQDSVFQTAAASLPIAYVLSTSKVLVGVLGGFAGGASVGKVQSAPTVSNGDIVITTRSSVNGGGRGNVYLNVVRIHQTVK